MISANTFRVRSYFPLLALFALVLSYYFILWYSDKANSNEEQFAKFQQEFLVQQQKLFDKTLEVEHIIVNSNNNLWPSLERTLNADDILGQIYWRDSLVFWNSQKVNNDYLLAIRNHNDTVIQMSTGWFISHATVKNDFKIYLLKHIKSEYEYDNIFLPDVLDKAFGGAQNLRLTADTESAGFIVKDIDGKNCVGVNIDESTDESDTVLILMLCVYLLSFLAVILILEELYKTIKRLYNRKIGFLTFFCLDLILLRVIDYLFVIPTTLKTSFLFNPGVNEIAGLNTTGDLLINSMILLVIAYKIYTEILVNKDNEVKYSPGYQIGTSVLIIIITGLLFFALYSAISSLEYNSLIGIKILNIKGLSSIISFIFMGFSMYLFLSIYLIILGKSLPQIILPITVIIAIGAAFYLLFPAIRLVVLVSSVFLILAIGVNIYQTGFQDIKMIKFLLTAIIFASAGSVIINQVIKRNKDIHQKVLVDQLAETHDLSLESQYNSVASILGSDRRIQKIIQNNQDPEYELTEYIGNQYFQDYVNKYKIQVTACFDGELLEVKDEGLIYDCSEFFNGMISNSGTKRVSNGFYLVESLPASMYYLGNIIYSNPNELKQNYNLFIEFYYSYVPEGLGYPELLIDNSSVNIDLSDYSFGFYETNQLSLKFGNFPYQTELSFMNNFSNEEFFKLSGFTHYKIEINENKCLILSRPNIKLSEQIVSFSALFLGFIAVTFITLIVIFGRQTRSQLANSFRNRLQILIVSTISLVVALLALITLYYVESNNENTLHQHLNEKTYSVLIELEHKLIGENVLEENDKEYLYQILRKFSMVFFSDINFYNTSGQIVASSRPEIFKRGLISENINPMAYEEIFVKNKLFYITRETIGDATYYSSYAPLTLNSGDPVGIVNLPYFAKQSEVRKAYFLMLFTFINLFVIFGIIGAMLGLFLSRILSKPLFLLQKSIGNLRIDQKNERLEWDREDEIGQLIAEYNLMVEKLEQSAEMLKHSERESTWREVARQIAHEIKNPLTPMKLNVQYLEKAYKENDPDFGEKVKNISALLISQIDSLDKVAEMFSDFAKSNAGKFEDVDLVKVVRSSVSLFRGHTKIKINIEIENQNEKYIVKAVEKDLLRVFNNLLKNSVQSLEGVLDGKIEVFIENEDYHFIVRIIDNGKGIPVESRAKIFRPYFTTKSGGTGLGLAITKNIMSEIGGEISFEPGNQGGTMFILKFRQAF